MRTRCDRLGRVFYRVCQDAIPYPEDYALNKARWFSDVCIYSFAFNLWAADTRSLEERQKNPRVLDVGWTEFDSPTDSDDLRAVSTTHLFLEENRLLMNKGRKRLVGSAANPVPLRMVLNLCTLKSLPDVSQAMPRASVQQLLQDLFLPGHSGESGSPKLLLVHDETTTRHVLRSFGVDPDALHWVRGIKDLLYCPLWERGNGRGSFDYKRDEYRSHTRDSRPGHPDCSRNRSRSPRRRAEDERYPRSRSPPSRLETPSVYVVDVRQLYHYLMLGPTTNETVPLIAKALNVRDTAMARGEDDLMIYEDIDPQYWCAGRGSRCVLFSSSVAHSHHSRPPID